MDFAEFLARTSTMQVDAFGVDPRTLSGEERAEWLRWNVLGATDELHELLHEYQWKPWKDNQGFLGDRDAAVEELVDVLHFVGNLAILLGVSAEELADTYAAKAAKNVARQRSR